MSKMSKTSVEAEPNVVMLPAGTVLRHVQHSAQIGQRAQPRNRGNTYYIHDNGGRPFKVVIEAKDVCVYKQDGWDNENKRCLYEEKAAHTFAQTRVFIGTSPYNDMTSFSGGHGPQFDGNSILVQTGNLEYVFIGPNIHKFVAKAPIAQYVSPVGNNDVPYPYAIDKEGRYYLVTESVVLENLPDGSDEHRYFYDNHQMVASPSNCCHVQENKEFDGIKKVWKGNKGCYLWYQPRNEDLGYDWTRGKYRGREGSKLYGQKGRGNPKFEITREMYIDLMSRFATQQGFSRLNETEIEPRDC